MKILFKIFEKEGLIISKKKIELGKTYVNFLGSIMGNGTIKLQSHITKEILEFPDLKEIYRPFKFRQTFYKGSWKNIRTHIPKKGQEWSKIF